MRCALEREDRNEVAELLNTLRRENRITFKAIYACEREHRDEIQTMDSMFRLESEEDIRRCLTIPQLLDPENADALVDYFCSKHRDNQWVSAVKYHHEGYKILLLTAFIFNPSFFAMAWNWCSLYRHEVREQMLREQEHRGSGNGFTVIHGTPRSDGVDLGPLQWPAAASGMKDPVIEKQIDDDEHNIHGKLRIVNRGSGVEVIFTFTENADNPPYYVVVQGGQQKPIRLDHRMSGKMLSVTSQEISWEDWNDAVLNSGKVFREDINDA